MTKSKSITKRNRENALLSTGPRSLEGKKRSSMNSLQHGLRSEKPVISGESESQWLEHLSMVEDSLCPANALERHIVGQIALTSWRQFRLVRYELAATERAEKLAEEMWRDWVRFDPLLFADSDKLAAFAELAVVPDNKRLGKLLRYEAHLDRRLTRLLEQLEKVRKLNRKNGKRVLRMRELEVEE